MKYNKKQVQKKDTFENYNVDNVVVKKKWKNIRSSK